MNCLEHRQVPGLKQVPPFSHSGSQCARFRKVLVIKLSSTDLVESNMANIERKFTLVGYCKLLSLF